MYGSNPQYNSHSICRKVKYVHRLMQIKERLDKIEHDISGRTTVVCTCQFVTSGLIYLHAGQLAVLYSPGTRFGHHKTFKDVTWSTVPEVLGVTRNCTHSLPAFYLCTGLDLTVLVSSLCPDLVHLLITFSL